MFVVSSGEQSDPQEGFPSPCRSHKLAGSWTQVGSMRSSSRASPTHLAVDNEPDPATPKDGAGSALGSPLLLHLLSSAKGTVNHPLKLGGGLGVLGLVVRSHLVPEERVVVVPPSAVADPRGSSEGISLKVPDVNGRLVLHGVVDVGDVCVVVLKVGVGMAAAVVVGGGALERRRA